MAGEVPRSGRLLDLSTEGALEPGVAGWSRLAARPGGAEGSGWWSTGRSPRLHRAARGHAGDVEEHTTGHQISQLW